MGDSDVKVVPAAEADEMDKALGLKLISIRLPIDMIEDFKLVASIRGVIYQPLMRDAMAEWIEKAKTNILQGVAFDQRERAKKKLKSRA